MSTQSFNWSNCLEGATVSDIGMRRTNNQDAHAVVLANDLEHFRARGHLLIVADGMGAHAAGELASKLAVDGIPHHYHKYVDLSPPEALHKAFLETNAEVHRRGQANTDFHNMGTTTSVLLLLPQGALVAHVGDSRVYRLRGQHLEQLTFDHSLVWELQKAGQLSADSDVAHAVPKNVITRSLGPNPIVQVDFEGPFPVQVGDTFLLCSDGLTGQVDDEELGTILASFPPAEAAQVLVDLANLRGGPDNITAIVARATGVELATSEDGVQPLMIGGGRRLRPRAHPFLWVLAGACWLTAVLLWAADYNLPAGVALVGGLIPLGIGLWQQFGRWHAGTSLGRGHLLGQGPYRSAVCTPNQVLVDRLATIVEQLQEAAAENDWRVDWDSFRHFHDQALRSTHERRFVSALRDYGQAIRFMMQELRDQKRRV